MVITRSNPRALFRVLSGAVILSITGCAGTGQLPPSQAPPPTAAEIRFEHLTERYLDEMLALTPVAATALGEHRFDALLDDVSPEGFAKRATLASELSAQLDGIDVTQLTRAHQVDLQLLRTELARQQWEIGQLQEWRWNPLLYTSLAGDSVYGLMARDFAPLQARLVSVAARLAEMPRLLAQVRRSLDPARVPAIHAQTAIEQNGGVLRLIDELVAPQVPALPVEQQTALKSAIAQARTAVAQHQIWLEKKLLPAAHGDFHLGAGLYDSKLHYELDTSLSRQEIRERAQQELTRTRAQMYQLAVEVLRDSQDAPALPSDPDPQQQQVAGFRDHDPLMRLIHLKWNLRAIANAILDQAVHVDRSSPEDALHLLMHDAFQEQSEADAKWLRVQLTAGQLPSYFVGWQEHLQLRTEVQQAWGTGFTAQRYHDALLAYGSPPVRYVRELLLNLPISP